MKSVNLSSMTIPPTIMEMVPESVARENVLIPIGEEKGMLQIVMSGSCSRSASARMRTLSA